MKDLVIRGGYVVSMEPVIGDLPVGDVLISGGHIVAVEKHIEVPGCEELDASGSLVFPGFVNGHQHLWQSILRGFSSDWSFPEYMQERAKLSGCFDADAAYVSNLLGGLECLAAGITTVVDHSHLQKSTEISDALVRGLLDSGVAGFFCYGLQNVTDFIERQPEDARSITNLLTRPADDWHYENASRIRRTYFDTKPGRLKFGVALAEGVPYGSHDEARLAFDRAEKLKPELLTAHWNGLHIFGFYKSNLSSLEKDGALNVPAIFSHNNDLSEKDLEVLVRSHIGHCTCPDIESGMGSGRLIARKFADMGGNSSLGIDSSCIVGPSMLQQAHLMLQIERMTSAASVSGVPKEIGWPMRKVLELLTVSGARAVGLGDEIGSLTPGKRADLIVVRPNAVAAQPFVDPVATLLFYTENADIAHVLVNGEFRKKDGAIQGLDMANIRLQAKRALERVTQRYHTLPDALFEKAWGNYL